MRRVARVMAAVAACAAVTMARDARAADGAVAAAATGPTESGLARAACLDRCAEGYKVCTQRREAKHPGVCGGAAVRCRAACPPSAQRAEAAPALPATEAAHPQTVEPAASAGSGAGRKGKRSRSARQAPPPVVPNAGAVPVPVPGQAEPVRSERRVTAEAPTVSAAESGPPPAVVAEPARRHRRNLLDTVWCVFKRCVPEDDRPASCSESCSDDYQACVSLGDKRESQTCAADLLRCRERCGSTQARDGR